MTRLLMVGLLTVATCAIGCETGSQRENLADQGAKGQKVGMNSDRKGGPVPGSTTGTEDTQRQSTPPETTPQQ